MKALQIRNVAIVLMASTWLFATPRYADKHGKGMEKGMMGACPQGEEDWL